MMLSGNRVPELELLYWIDDLKLLRRDILLLCPVTSAGNERNQHRKIGRSLRGLSKNDEWLDSHTIEGPKYGYLH